MGPIIRNVFNVNDLTLQFTCFSLKLHHSKALNLIVFEEPGIDVYLQSVELYTVNNKCLHLPGKSRKIKLYFWQHKFGILLASLNQYWFKPILTIYQPQLLL